MLDEREARADQLTAEVLARPDVEEIPPLTHREHHVIFRGFLATLPSDVTECCNQRSIGGFLNDQNFHFDDAYRDRWAEYHDAALRERAAAWLRERGFAVSWIDLATRPNQPRQALAHD